MQQTLVLLKPDGVQRGLIGEMIARFEKVGLKIIALKMLCPSRDTVDRHYVLTEEWMKAVYDKAKKKYEDGGQAFPYTDAPSYGKFIKDGLVDFLSSGPVVAMVLEGEQAVPLVRKMVGATEPQSSAPGTIRGDYSPDSYSLSNTQGRPLRNLIHASGTVEEAQQEITVWFAKEELCAYEHVLGGLLYDADFFRP